MLKVGDLMEENEEVVGEVESLDNGKGINERRNGDMGVGIEEMGYYGGWRRKMNGERIGSGMVGMSFCEPRSCVMKLSW
ncbi:aldehyde dehydrogenase family protein [Bacillus sp. WP8]|uniref:aldehyde dehydrogenase family protein n=1 Tax=Bacillus sp. WP8 TaxID=756828 RepID=UPI0021B6C459|nr:aldehyde dehydrogenase family protein [Bacillus sp. WP8]